METRANFVLIGAFTLAIIAGMFGLAFWFTKNGAVTPRTTYQVLFNGSVSGLSPGGLVLFNGLHVGEVTSVDFVADDPSRVRALIQVQSRVPVKQDTKARLELQGLTGGAALALAGGSPEAKPLAGIDGQLPTLVAEPSQIQNLLESVQSISAKADQVLGRVDALVSQNGGVINDTLKNLDNFSKALGDNSSGLGDALAGVGDLGRKIGPLAERLQKLSDDVDKLVVAVDSTKVKHAVDNLSSFTEGLADSRDQVKSILSDSAALAKRLNGMSAGFEAAINDVDSLIKAFDLSKISSFVAGAGDLGKKVGPLTDRLQKLSDDVDKVVGSVDSDKLKRTLDNVAVFTDGLAQSKTSVTSMLTDTATLAKKLTDVPDRLNTALTDADGLIKSFDMHKVSAFLDGAGALGDTLKDNRGNVDRFLKDAAELSAKLNQSADKLDGLMTSVQGFVGSSDTKGPLAQVGDAAASVRKFADDLDLRVKEVSVGLQRFTSSGLREYEGLAVDGRKTLNDLDRLLRSIEKNPNQLIFGAKTSLPEYHGSP